MRFEALLRRIAKIEPGAGHCPHCQAIASLPDLELEELEAIVCGELTTASTGLNAKFPDGLPESRSSCPYCAKIAAMSEEELDADIAKLRSLFARSKKQAEEMARRDAQTICDGCGCDLHGNAWHAYKGGTMQKLCKTCIGL